MTRRTLIALCIGLMAGPALSAQAQDRFAWSRATIGLHAGSVLTAEQARDLRETGFDAVAVAVRPGEADRWAESIVAAREAGLYIVADWTRVDRAMPTSDFAVQTQASGFDGILMTGPGGPESPSQDAASGDAMPFAWLQAAAGGADGTEMAGGDAEAAGSLESLFSDRARTPDEPDAAPVAVITGSPDPRSLLLPGPVALEPPETPDAAWSAIARFRQTHPAVADGLHEPVSEDPHAFYRGLRIARDDLDEILVVLGAAGRVRLNVSSFWPDDVILRDAMTGEIGLVSFGQVTLPAGPDGIMLLEVLE